MGTFLETTGTSLKPFSIIGKYQILELIGRGGMAEVYKAKRYGAEGFEKILVLKRILPELANNREFVELFINEAKIAMHLNHTNIVQVLDLEQDNGEYFLAMEYVHGMNLAEIIRRSFARGLVIPAEIIAYLGSEVAKGLDYAHRRRGPDMTPLELVHRDISPQNILVSFEGEVKITDFGIAAAKNILTVEEKGFVKGKFAYIAPEQLLGERVDRRADLFSLGVVMYEMACGQNPFRQPTGQLTIEKIIRHDFMPLSKIAPHIPEELSGIIEKCLAAKPEDRYQNAGALYEDLLSFIYTTGKRVSSTTISQFVGSFRDIQHMEEYAPIEEGLDEAISIPAKTTMEITNVAIPVPAKEELKEVEEKKDEVKPDLSVEQHDFSILSIEYLSSETGKEKEILKIDQIIEMEGGKKVEESPGFIVALFGMGELSGKETETAVQCALKIKQMARKIRKNEGRIIPVGVAVKQVRLFVDKSGKPIEDKSFLDGVVSTRKIAQKYSDRVTVLDAEGPFIEEKFESQKADVLDPSLPPNSYFVLREKIQKAPKTRFIGRNDALRQMAEILAACSKGSGRIIGISGEAGIGKSRFVEEVHSRIRQKIKIFWYGSICLPQEQTIPLSAIGSMVKIIIGITEDDTDKNILEKIKRLRELGLNLDEIEAVKSLIGIFTGRSSGTETFYSLVQSAMGKIARALSQDRLTIFVWENIRYMDQESTTTIENLISSILYSRVLIITTMRSGFKPKWINNPRFKEIVLEPLPDTDISKIAIEILGNPTEVPRELLTEIISKSGGNPLFLEENLRALLMSGAIKIENKKVIYDSQKAPAGLPRTLRGIFAERLSKLSDENKDLLKVASVIGSKFSVDYLSEAIGKPIYQLAMSLEELECEGILTRSGVTEYSFKHDFIREAIYDSIPHSSRRNLHEKIANIIESSPSGRPDEVLSILAYHWRESGNRVKAIDYLLKSADKMAEDYHYLPALYQYLKAADLVRNSPSLNMEKLLEIYDRIGDMSIMSAKMDIGIEKMKLAADLAEEMGDRKRLVLAVTKIGKIATAAGKFSEALRNFSRALELSEGLTDLSIRRDIYGSIGIMHAKNGEYLQSSGFLEEALKLSKMTGDLKAQHAYTRQIGIVMAALNKADAAKKYIDEAEKQAQNLNDRMLACELMKTKALVHFMLREWQEALEFAQHALELAKEYNFPYEIAVNSHNIGDIHIRQKNFKKAFTALQFSYEISREYSFKKLEVINMVLLGYIDAVRFGSSDGIEKIKAGIKYAFEKQYSWDAVQGKYFLGLAYYELKEYDEAIEALKDAIRLGRTTGNLLYVEDSEKILKEIEIIKKPH